MIGSEVLGSRMATEMSLGVWGDLARFMRDSGEGGGSSGEGGRVTILTSSSGVTIVTVVATIFSVTVVFFGKK